MYLKSDVLELRSVLDRKGKSGSVYYLVNCECDGVPVQFYVRNSDVFPPALSKGDNIVITFDYSRYDKETRLSVVSIEKVV